MASRRTSPTLTAPSTTATTPTAAMLGGPPLWTREPTHNANRGPPVQMLIVDRLMAHTSATRLARTRRPTGPAACPPAAATRVISAAGRSRVAVVRPPDITARRNA